uniref:C2H2-type domain-containing protein n=1 Tax=Caenorhabditis japonica TaxID=281687 RepID=A0A8R1I4W5_CAEJA
MPRFLLNAPCQSMFKKNSGTGPSPSNQQVCCQQCDEQFDSFAQFAVHMKSHIAAVTQVFYCPLCPVGIPFRDKKIHVTQHVCNECESVFASNSALVQHFFEAHRKFVCTGCDFVSEGEKAFREHTKVHSRQITMYGCALCGNSYSSQSRLINHVQVTHDQDTLFPPTLLTPKPASPSPKPVKPRALQCSVCDETVFGEEGLDEHRLIRHCKVRYADKCADCHEPIDTEASFVEHCLRHTKDHVHHCPVCRQSLRSETQIHAHCAHHMRKSESELAANDSVTKAEEEEDESTLPDAYNFVCPICGVKLEDGFQLIEHSKRHMQDDA